jgi:predicted metal-dependent phosphoesterase TrpH
VDNPIDHDRWRIDLHVHSFWSYDACSSWSSIIRVCQKNQLDVIALTDHDEISGAIELLERAPFRVIVGEEITTKEGEVIGLFLKQRIPPGMSLESAVRAIKEQGGIVYLPHPYEVGRRGVSRQSLIKLGMDQVDVLEVYNARSMKSAVSEDLAIHSGERQLRLVASSDAHTPWEIGRACTLVSPFEGPQDLLESLEQAELVCRRTPILYRVCLNHRMRRLLRSVYLCKSKVVS